jgi:hypothetical protein
MNWPGNRGAVVAGGAADGEEVDRSADHRGIRLISTPAYDAPQATEKRPNRNRNRTGGLISEGLPTATLEG